MNFINILKKFGQVSEYYFKEKTNLWIFVMGFYFAIVIHYINFMKKEPFAFLLILKSCFIVYALGYITILQIENHRQKHKNSCFDKFLNKFEYFESFFKKDNLIKGAIIYIFRILIIFFIAIVFIKISSLTKSFIYYITSTLGFISLLISINLTIKFFIDLILLIEGKKNNNN